MNKYTQQQLYIYMLYMRNKEPASVEYRVNLVLPILILDRQTPGLFFFFFFFSCDGTNYVHSISFLQNRFKKAQWAFFVSYDVAGNLFYNFISNNLQNMYSVYSILYIQMELFVPSLKNLSTYTNYVINWLKLQLRRNSSSKQYKQSNDHTKYWYYRISAIIFC